MLRSIVALVGLVLAVPVGQPGRALETDERRTAVRYVANAGMLVTVANRRFLIDAPIREGIAPYATSSAEERTWLEGARAPYDRVDAILVTHWHEDHFSPDAVAAHLSRSASTLFVSSPEVVDRLRHAAPQIPSSQLRAMLPSPGEAMPIDVAGVPVRVLRIRHNPTRRLPEQHVGFLIGSAPATVLHVGDADPAADNFALLQQLPRIDLALLPFWYVLNDTNRRFVADSIKPRRIVAMHVPPSDAVKVGETLRAANVDAILAARPGSTLTIDQAASKQAAAAAAGLAFIDTSVENASPLWYEVVDGVVRVHLLYDHERASPNRAAGHFHFVLHGQPGTSLTLELVNLDNVWNGQPGSVAGEIKNVVISEDGQVWKTVPTERVADNRVQARVTLTAPKLHVARLQPYRLSDLERLLASIRANPLVHVDTIGQTVGGRDLEIVRIGHVAAPHRVFVRARAHPWEAGSSWVAQGLIERLLAGDEETTRFLRVYSVSVLPMANKDGVARGGTRFNLRGKDLNRDWDRPADPALSPENAALERWLEREIAAGRKPDLALELHNDGNGRLHISRPPVPQLDRYLARMTRLEQLLRRHTWFTEGTTSPTFRNSGTLGEGWLQRYGIDAVVHEFNANWIAGLQQPTSAAHWRQYGADLTRVFHDYFTATAR